jgi:hypothetical protein
VRRFALSKLRPGRWEFSGLTYEQTGPETMTATVVSKDMNGKEEILEFRFRRKSR